MSTSSCPSDPPELTEDQARAQREEEVYQKSKEFLRQIAVNLCIPEGMSGKFDIAFKVDRQKQIARAMRELAEELDAMDNG